jgi:hypothetical protein
VVIVEEKWRPVKISGPSGLLKISSAPPHAKIRVKKRDWGTTPMRKFRRVKAGRVRIEIIHRSFPPVDTFINVENNDSTRLHFQLDR